MQPGLLKVLDTIRSSYWFITTVMAVASAILGVGMVILDTRLGSDWLKDLEWYQSNTPDGAREVLSTIASSAITVAGVVFSITIVAVSFAAGQYGPRVLSNFMRDRGNQITLGTFIATFLYCILVIRTIRGGDDDDLEFVPDLAIIVAILLALCSIAVLIYFIHHIPRSIHANVLVARIGRQLVEAVGRLFPEFIGSGETSGTAAEAPLRSPATAADHAARDHPHAVAIHSPRTGYIETMDDTQLMEVASSNDLVLALECRPGDFIHRGRVFARVWSKAECEDGWIDTIKGAFAVGSERTPLQDTRYLFDELVEVGARALSPGINDPFTAIACVDWLGAGLSEVARRVIPTALRADDQGAVRVIAVPLDFAGYVWLAFGQFRPYLACDRNAAARALETLGSVASDCEDSARIAALRAEADALTQLATERLGERLAATLPTAFEHA